MSTKRTGIVFEKDSKGYIVALREFTKIIHYRLPPTDVPSNIILNIGDTISYELATGSTMKAVRICNIQLISAGEYIQYIADVVKGVKALPVATRFQLKKIISHSLLAATEIAPFRLVEDFSKKYGYTMSYYTTVNGAFEPEIVLVDNKLL